MSIFRSNVLFYYDKHALLGLTFWTNTFGKYYQCRVTSKIIVKWRFYTSETLFFIFLFFFQTRKDEQSFSSKSKLRNPTGIRHQNICFFNSFLFYTRYLRITMWTEFMVQTPWFRLRVTFFLRQIDLWEVFSSLHPPKKETVIRKKKKKLAPGHHVSLSDCWFLNIYTYI